MPVTKKKGAFFAIYADSPAQSTRSSNLPRPASPTASPTKKQSVLSTTTTTTTRRKALTIVQSRSTGFPSETTLSGKGKARAAPLGDEITSAKSKGEARGENDALKVKAKTKDSASEIIRARPDIPSINPKSTVAVTRVSSTSRKLSAKRQFEIFRAPSPSSASTSASPAVARPATTAQAAPAPLQDTASSSAQSPTKKTRSTPRRAPVEVDDKENSAPSTLDSPASRTRSKARLGPDSTGMAESPLQPLRLGLGARGVKGNPDGLIGDGRGTLTLKKGRALASVLMGDKEMAVLGDVSEAYGAEGDEPVGFRNQRR